jgi:two-component system response regulator DesR
MDGFQVVADCASDAAVVEQWTNQPPGQRPEIVLLEISLKHGDGFHYCRELRLFLPDLIIALHTTHCLPCFVNGARHADADAYFRKPADLHRLAAELAQLHRTSALLVGQGVLNGGVTGSLTILRDPRLSPRMEEILELEAQGCQPKEIADRLGMGLQTVYTQRHRALERLRSACSPDPTQESRLS